MNRRILFTMMLAVFASACSYVEDEQNVTTSAVAESKSTTRLVLNDKNEVEMQRRKFGIWFGTDADNMVIGWGVMELVNAPRADENQAFDNTQLYILKKDFPFYKGYTFFCVPKVNYTNTNYDYLATYKRGMDLFGRNIPSWLSYESIASGLYLPGDNNKLEPI